MQSGPETALSNVSTTCNIRVVGPGIGEEREHRHVFFPRPLPSFCCVNEILEIDTCARTFQALLTGIGSFGQSHRNRNVRELRYGAFGSLAMRRGPGPHESRAEPSQSAVRRVAETSPWTWPRL
jgi:hypothetical protein